MWHDSSVIPGGRQDSATKISMPNSVVLNESHQLWSVKPQLMYYIAYEHFSTKIITNVKSCNIDNHASSKLNSGTAMGYERQLRNR